MTRVFKESSISCPSLSCTSVHSRDQVSIIIESHHSTIQLVSMPTSRTRTSDDEQIAAEIRAMREACEAGGFPLSRETTRGFVTPRNRPPPASLTNRPARTASPLRVATAPARLLTERVHRSGSHSPCMGKAPSSVPPFWSKPAGPARPFLGEMRER
jgi:hypothetical protein